MIAALYVETNGVYCGLPDVEPWDKARDARKYAGPWPVVAHPPCERWGRFWYGSPLNARAGKREQLGDDGGCFEAALWAVRTFGGVLEHPACSRAWQAFGLARPKAGWMRADSYGYTCQVDQSHYGHRARKSTWLYAAHAALPELEWQPLRRPDPDGRSRRGIVALMSHRQRAATPIPFRDLLLSIARSARMQEAA